MPSALTPQEEKMLKNLHEYLLCAFQAINSANAKNENKTVLRKKNS
jgi:hypothetical protein